MNSKFLFTFSRAGIGWFHFMLVVMVLSLSGKAWGECPGGHDIPIECSGAAPPECTYAATPGQTINPVEEISVTGIVPGNVFWSVAPVLNCSGSSLNYTCLGMAITLPPGSDTTGALQTNPVTLGGTAQGSMGESQFTLTVTDVDDTSRTCDRTYRPRVTATGGGWGDPHITTVDGVKYDFQSAGEFISLRGDGIEVQTRQTAVSKQNVSGTNAYTGLASCVSIYTAVALRVGSHRVTIQPNISGVPDPSGLQIRVDGVLKTLGPDGIELVSCNCSSENGTATAGQIQRSGRIQRAADEESIEILYTNGNRVVVTPKWWANQQKWYLNVNVYDTTASQGIMGKIAEGSWLPALSDGSTVGDKAEDPGARYDQLYETFADSWRVTDANSLFDYAPGTSTATFTIDEWPRKTAATSGCLLEGQPTAEPVDQAVAEQACAGVVDPDNQANCIFDVRETGHLGFADAYVSSEQVIPGATQIVLTADKAVSKPGMQVTFTATVRRAISTIGKLTAGRVQFSLNGSNVGEPVDFDNNGAATWSTSSLALGSHEVQAQFLPSAFGEQFRTSSGKIAHKVTRTGTDDDTKPSDPNKWLIWLLILLLGLILGWLLPRILSKKA